MKYELGKRGNFSSLFILGFCDGPRFECRENLKTNDIFLRNTPELADRKFSSKIYDGFPNRNATKKRTSLKTLVNFRIWITSFNSHKMVRLSWKKQIINMPVNWTIVKVLSFLQQGHSSFETKHINSFKCLLLTTLPQYAGSHKCWKPYLYKGLNLKWKQL